MKKLYCIIVMSLAAVSLSSCLKNTENDYPTNIAFATVQVAASTPNSYHFTLDTGKSLYPGDVSRIGNYDTKEKEGKRAIIYFNYLEQPAVGYDYNAALYAIDDILTKEIERATTEEELKKFGNDPIDTEQAWISGGHLNILYRMPRSGMGVVKHRLSLADNKTATPPVDMPEGYTYLEFLHNADGDTSGMIYRNYVSFRLGDYAPSETGSKGIYLKIKTLSGKVNYMKIGPQKK